MENPVTSIQRAEPKHENRVTKLWETVYSEDDYDFHSDVVDRALDLFVDDVFGEVAIGLPSGETGNNGEVIGFLLISEEPVSQSDPSTPPETEEFVYALLIHPEWKNESIAEKLLEFAYNKRKWMGATKLVYCEDELISNTTKSLDDLEINATIEQVESDYISDEKT